MCELLYYFSIGLLFLGILFAFLLFLYDYIEHIKTSKKKKRKPHD